MEQRNHYLEQAVLTASPAHLVTMLYDRLLVAVHRVQQALESPEGDRNQETCHSELLRAQRIIEELRYGLDQEAGGDIAQNLRHLYDYCHDLLVAANVAKSSEGLDVVVRIITEVREVWYEQVDRGPVGAIP